jgi:hypothetical protein
VSDLSFDVAASTPEQCAEHLAALEGNKGWRELLSAKDPATFARFHRVAAKAAGVELPEHADGLVRNADGQIDLMNGRRNLPPIETVSSEFGTPVMTTAEALEQFETLRAKGFSDSWILERFDTNREYTVAEVEEAKARWAGLMSDPEFQKRLAATELTAMEELGRYAKRVNSRIKAA